MVRIETQRENAKARVKAVKVTWDADECNRMLAAGGWELACCHVAHRDAGGYACVPCFILKRI